MEIGRKCLVIYYNSHHCLKKIENLGNLIYHSKKLRYAYLYVDEKQVNKSMEAIKKIHGVNKVELSLVEMEEFNFTL
jgi:uncharacterized protein YlbG (UPF0298 family)